MISHGFEKMNIIRKANHNAFEDHIKNHVIVKGQPLQMEQEHAASLL